MALTKVTGELVDIGDLDISNVGDIAVDTISGDGDSDTKIKMGDPSNGISIHCGGADQVLFVDGAIRANTNNDIDLGSSSKKFKDYYGAGTLQADGNATIGGTLGVTGVVTANAGVVIDNITIDGTEIDLSGSSDLMIDVGGRINLSADDNGEVRLYDGSSLYGQFKDDDDRLTIQGLLEDKDMLFVVNDGGTATTAMKIDASDAGTVIFYHDIKMGDNDVLRIGDGGDLTLFHDASNSHITNDYGVLYIDQRVDDGNFILRCDDQSGGLAEYIVLDGGAGDIKFTAISDIIHQSTSTNSTAGHHIFKSYNTEIMRIDGANNRVGIGTTSPSQLLHVSSTGSAGILLEADSDNANEDHVGEIQITQDGGATYHKLGTNNDNHAYINVSEALIIERQGTEKMRMSNGGKIGIGETATDPQYMLDVHGTSDVTMRVHRPSSGLGATDTCGIGFSHRGDTGSAGSDTRAGIFSTYNGNLFLSTEPSGNLNSNPMDHSAFMITGSDQDVIIGSGTSAGATGSITFYKESNFVNITNNTTSSASNGNEFQTFRHDTTQIGSITLNGTTATSYNTSSDYRLKENVDYTWDATTRLKQLKPCRFNWIADDTNTLEDGFLAHEVQAVVPNAVTGTKDQMEDYVDDEGETQQRIKSQQMDHSKLVPLLVKTIQELEARITELENA